MPVPERIAICVLAPPLPEVHNTLLQKGYAPLSARCLTRMHHPVMVGHSDHSISARATATAQHLVLASNITAMTSPPHRQRQCCV